MKTEIDIIRRAHGGRKIGVTLTMPTRALLVSLATATALACADSGPRGDRVLIMIVDGLRPDYVTPEVMPRLSALRDGGLSGENHHSVFPTVTRVNSSSIATGAYPRTHGMMGNSVYLDWVDAERVLNTGEAANLRLINDSSGGRLLTAPSLAEVLERNGKTLFAVSSGSSGSAMLMNREGRGGGLAHPEVFLPPESQDAIEALVGPAPSDAAPRMSLVAWTIDVLLGHGIDALDADALMIWITEPDGTAHATGVGSPETLDILRSVDAEIGRLLDGLAQRGILESTNILVTADHGFSTRTGTQSVAALLRERGLKRTETDVVVAGGAIHVNEGGEDRIREIVRVLQETDWVGPILTRGADASTTQGSIDGTLAFSTIAWDHDRSADILTTGNWSSAENEFGFPGEVMEPGLASHGTLSPYDVRTTFIVHGPAIKQGVRSTVPTGNIDLAPTALALLGLPVPDGMDGRVIDEAFTDGPDIDAVEVDTREITATATGSGRNYVVILQKSFVAGTEYVDLARVERVLPVVVLMDSPHPTRVYDEETRAANGTNADVLSDILLDLPIQRLKESIGPDWDRDEEILQLRPDLIVIHYSGFRQGDGSGPRERLKLLISYFEESDTRFLIYSRQEEARLRRSVDELLSDRERDHPGLLARIEVFGLDDYGHRDWRSPLTANPLKLRVREILGLEG